MPRTADKPISAEALRLMALLAEEPDDRCQCPHCFRACHPMLEGDDDKPAPREKWTWYCPTCGEEF